MAIPKHILEVARPINTVVTDYGKDGPKRYAVRERKGVRYGPGGNPQPINGRVIGHIVDGVYVPKQQVSADADMDMLSYGSATFAYSVSSDLLSELLQVYDARDAYCIMAIATLRAIRPAITTKRLEVHYRRTFVSKYYSDADLSTNHVRDFYETLGRAGKLRRAFFQLHASRVAAEHHIAIDSILEQDSDTMDDFSAFSYGAQRERSQEVSVLFAYDITTKEPVCADVFPGNNIDAASYCSYIREYGLSPGIFVSDKSFLPSKTKGRLYGEKSSESDMGMDSKAKYTCYDDCCLLRQIFARFKRDERIGITNVQGEFSIIGSGFIDYISAVITCRLIKKAREAELLNEISYDDLMDDLSSAWRMIDTSGEPETGDKFWVHTQKTVFDELEALGLSKPIPKPTAKRRRGSERKNNY